MTTRKAFSSDKTPPPAGTAAPNRYQRPMYGWLGWAASGGERASTPV